MVYGNLTRDVELKALPSGQNVANMSVATNHTYTDKDGKKQENAEFHNVVVFGKTAENCAKYLSKGNGVLVEGRLQTRSWDKDGVKMYRTEIIAERVQFGLKNGGAAAPSGGSQSSAAPADDGKAPKVPDYSEEEINPEDIPF